MTRLPCLVAALFYVGLAAAANPAAALTPDQRAGLEALRQGDMRKLVVADAAAPAPDVAVSDRDGTATTLAAQPGRLRLVNFWATWCAPCRKEMPSLAALAADRPELGLVLVATGRNEPAAIDRFASEVGLPDLDTLLDPKGEAAAAFGVPGLPVTLLLDADGAEIARLLGEADWNAPEAQAIVDYLLALP